MSVELVGAFLFVACVFLTLGAGLGYYTATSDAQRERDHV